MAQCVTKMVLDVAERDTVQSVVARQGDSKCRSILLRLLSHGELLRVEENATVLLYVKNSAGQTAAFVGEVNADGSLTLPLGAWMLREPDVLTCDVAVVDEQGGRLTTPPFEIEVMAAVSAEDVLPGDAEEGGITAELVGQERMLALKPTQTEGGFVLAPESRRHYALDLSPAPYGTEDGWQSFQLLLPTPADTMQENWVVITCHAPLRAGNAVPIVWGEGKEYAFVGCALPEIVTEDFDVICTYSNAAGRWNVGVIQYGDAEDAV